MPGFSTITGDESIMFADNCSFDGTKRGGKLTTNGQLFIGSTAAPHIKSGSIVSPMGTVTIGYSSPNITIDVAGGGSAVETLSGDFGGSVSPLSNNINLLGTANQITTTGTPGSHQIQWSLPSAVITPGSLTATTFLTATTDVTTSTGNFIMPLSTSTQGSVYQQTVGPILHTFSDAGTGTGNLFVGPHAGNFTLTNIRNTGVGDTCLASLTTGMENTAVGHWCLRFVGAGRFNVAMGNLAGQALVSGDNNILIGNDAGFNYSAAESNNICIGPGGTGGENNVIRIGTVQSSCYIVGIAGVNVGSVATVVTESGDQLGTATITAGTGISVTPGANTITISSTGSSVAWSDKNTNFSAVAGNGYFVTANATATLPASPSQGNMIQFAVDAAATTLTITANTGQVIRIGTAVSASAGTAANNARGDSVTLVFRSSDNAWIATSVLGTWTIT